MFLSKPITTSNQAAGNTTLEEIQTITKTNILYTGAVTNLSYQKVQNGVYTILSSRLACTPSATCEPDRYEIRLPYKADPVYGVGMQGTVNQVEIDDFLDTNFGSGHLTQPAEMYNGDIGRMRTPMLVLPKERMIIAYIQPSTKMIRLTRDATSGCPANNTCMVFKKHNLINEGTTGKMVIIKGTSVSDMYSKYYSYLKNNEQFYFKKPHWNAFGLFFESFNEFGMKAPTIGGATVTGFQNVINQYKNKGLKLSAIVFGSGYWQSNRQTACNPGDGDFLGLYRIPTIDSLTIKDTGLKTFYSNIYTNEGIYPIIGMRQHTALNTGNALEVLNPPLTGEQFLLNKFRSVGIQNPYFDGNYYYETRTGVRPPVRMIKTTDDSVVNTFIDFIKTAYGPIRGIKEDEMILANTQRHEPTGKNLPDGVVGRTFKNWTEQFNNDFIILGRNDWFGVGDDLQNSQGYVIDQPSHGAYELKTFLDSTLTHVVSGYPHPNIEATVFDLEYTGSAENVNCLNFCSQNWTEAQALNEYNNNCKIPLAKTKEYMSIFKSHVFTPAAMETRGFWHLRNQTDVNTYISFAKLRMRLHQYVYDHTQKWYTTGVPSLMQPLFITYQNDPVTYSLYKRKTNTTDAANEYMFGNALLVRPVFSSADTVSVYFPQGKWKSFFKAAPTYQQGTYSYLVADNDYPVFLKEGELLVIADETDINKMNAFIFLDTMTTSTEYTLYKKDGGIIRLQANKSGSTITIKNLDTLQTVNASVDPQRRGFHVADISTLLTSGNQNCPRKSEGDADCNGEINALDFICWKEEYVNGVKPKNCFSSDFDPRDPIGILDYVLWVKYYLLANP